MEENKEIMENNNQEQKEEKKVKKENKVLNKIKLFFAKKVILVIIILILIAIIAAGFTTNIFFQTKTTKLGLENVGKLVTQTCHTVIVQDTKVNKQIFDLKIPFSESRQIFSNDYDVDAYVDFENIKIETNNKTKTINIKIPHAKIDKATKVEGSQKIYLDEDSLFTRIDLKMTNEAETKMKEQAIEDCISNKILESADKNAINLLESLIKGNKEYKDYILKFEYINE